MPNTNISIEKKVAQMFITATPLLDDEKEFFGVIEKYISIGVGGFMIGVGGKLPFAQTDGVTDIKKLKKLTDKLKSLDPNLFLAIDGEGGEIFNLFENISTLKSQRHYGLEFEKSGSTQEYENDLDEYIGIMKECGINMNFAPVLDTAKNGYKGYLSEHNRAYSDKEETVKKLSGIAINKMRENEIIAVGKHFPGYGHIEKNPHTYLSVLSTDGVCKDKQNLFGNAISNHKIMAMMKGHVLSPIDKEIPATLSEKVEKHLREKLNFGGLSITDEIFMHSLSKYYDAFGGDKDHTKRVVAVAKANDIILMSYPKQKNEDGTIAQTDIYDNFEKLHNSVVQAVRVGEIDENKINESYERIAKIKSKINN